MGKDFHHKFNFLRYLRIDIGEKPYEFSECGKAFIYVTRQEILKKSYWRKYLHDNNVEKPSD